MGRMKTSLLRKEVKKLRTENITLCQAVSPENKKYLKEPVKNTPKKITAGDKIKNFIISHSKIMVIIFICLILAVILAVELIIFFGTPDNKKNQTEVSPPEAEANSEGNTFGNAMNGGYSSEQGDFIFYAGNREGFLYSYRKSTGEIKLLSNESCRQINPLGDKIYYVSEKTRELHSVKTDGSEKKLEDALIIDKLFISNNILYYTSFGDGCLYKVDRDNQTKEKLTEYKVSTFAVSGIDIFCVGDEDKTLYLNNEKVSDMQVKSIALTGKTLYIQSQENGLYFYNIEEKKISDMGITADSFNVSEKYFTYSLGSDLYLSKSNGSFSLFTTDFASDLQLLSSNITYKALDGQRYIVSVSRLDSAKILPD